MKIPLSWLGEYVDVLPIEKLLPRLTEIGHMVDGPAESTDCGPIVSLEIRQNRPDCLSILGIAREVGAAFGRPVRDVLTVGLPLDAHRPGSSAGEDYVCFLRIRGAKLKRLPEKMLGDLERYGQRPVNPLVDLANYVMVELGQPLHVYSAEGIDVASAASRAARTGESLRLLDGRTVDLSEDDLVIADARSPLALPGVMGGGASAVVGAAGDIVVEAGNFRSHLVRRTARRHGLATEASLRSSKLLPPELVEFALSRFLALILEHGQAGETELWRTGPMPDTGRTSITLMEGDLRRIGGMQLPPERSVEILQSLEFAAAALADGAIAATPPWWRTDVWHPADVIEEILRIEGYSRLHPESLPALPSTSHATTLWDQEERVRSLLCGWGYDEVILDSFLIDGVGGLEERPDVLRVENPPAGNGILRSSLLPNMLSGARFLPFLVPERRLFEIGRTFYCLGGCPEERRTVAWTVMKGSGAVSWNTKERRPDFYTIKAEAEALLRTLGMNVSIDTLEPAPFPFLPGRSARLVDEGGVIVGHVGELHHLAYGLKPVRASFGAELYLSESSSESAETFGTARRHADSLDISLLVKRNTSPSAVERVITEVLGSDLIAAHVVDIYEDTGAGEDRISLTFRVVYASSRGTPRDVWGKVGSLLAQRLDARVRGSVN